MPKHCIDKFMEAWFKKDSEKMLSVCQKTWIKNNKELSEDFFKCFFWAYDLLKYKIKKITKVGKCSVDADISITYKKFGKTNKRKIKTRIIQEVEAYKPDRNGEFGINPISFIKGL